MIDTYGREISYIRISVTDRCNFRCLYCTGGQAPPRLAPSDVLTFEEIVEVARAATRLGVAKIRITGGEPLIRRNIHKLISSLRSIDGIKWLGMTTNGSRLSSFLPHVNLLDSINVSLDTLKRERFAKLTCGGNLRDVWEPLLELLQKQTTRVRLNTVLLRNVNVDEVQDFAELSRCHPLDVRFIEFMPRGPWDRRNLDTFYIPISVAIERVINMGAVELGHSSEDHAGPATYYALPGSVGRIGFISAVSSPFCDRCNRIRLTADGRLKACLLLNSHVDVRDVLRRRHSEDEILDAIRTAVMMKPAKHRQQRPHAMVSIGG